MTDSLTPPHHIAIQALLDRTVPNWPKRLKTRWFRSFLPHWRADLLPEERLLRYLHIALRRGWFDEAAGALRWTAWNAALERAHQEQGIIPAHVALNLFNACAALPTLHNQLFSQLDHDAWRTLTHTQEALDAHALTTWVRAISTQLARQRDTPLIARIFHGQPVHPRAERWQHLAASHEKLGLTIVHIIEPFGSQSWEGVSALHLDASHRLVATSHPLQLTAIINPHDLSSELIRGEPSGELQSVRRRRAPGIRDLFPLPSKGLWAGILSDGAIAIWHDLATKQPHTP